MSSGGCSRLSTRQSCGPSYLVIHDHARSEEIAQDAFVQLLRHWEKIRQYEFPEAWVRRVAIRLAIRDGQRERRRRILDRHIDDMSPQASPPEPGIDPDLDAAVRSLSPRQRSVVVLFYFEDRPMDEIADIVGCSTSTGWVHLHRARKRLATLLSEEETNNVP